MKFLEKLYFYFEGRYGNDEFSKFLSLAGLITLVLSMIFTNRIIFLIAIVLISFGLLRIVSKETENRQRELNFYYKIKNSTLNFVAKIKALFTRNRRSNRRKTNMKVNKSGKTIVSCPRCSQKLRVPKGKKLSINCKNCGNQFVKRT